VASAEVTASVPWASGVHDLAVAELDARARAWLDDSGQQPFLNSLGYATVYDHPPATRVCVVVAADRSCRVGFYREVRGLAIFKVLEFVGFPTLNEDDLGEVLRHRNAQAASLLRLGSPGDDGVTSESPCTLITHDVIAALPVDSGAYLSSLGKQKRQQLPRYWRKLEREFEGRVRMEFVAGPEIDIAEINQLVAFNQQRMGDLGKGNSTDQESRKQLRREALTKEKGLLCTLLVRDTLVGGTFNYVHGDEAFLIVIAHDTAWDKHNVGHLALWKTIEHCLGLGVRRYHLFWGRKRYKNDFGGIDHPVMELVISRHAWRLPFWRFRRSLLRNGPRAMGWLSRKFQRRAITGGGDEG
jgi:hypothetical protein